MNVLWTLLLLHSISISSLYTKQQTTKDVKCNFFVSSLNGQDSNDGLSIETPFKTISHAITSRVLYAQGQPPEQYVFVQNYIQLSQPSY